MTTIKNYRNDNNDDDDYIEKKQPKPTKQNKVDNDYD
jgi:hypothetical protein